MCEKHVERVARLYHLDYVDGLDHDVKWSDLSEKKKNYWRDFARRRLERDS